MRALAARGLRLVARVARRLAALIEPWHIDVPSANGARTTDDLLEDGFELVEDRPTHPDGFAAGLDPVNTTIPSPAEEPPLEGSLAARMPKGW